MIHFKQPNSGKFYEIKIFEEDEKLKYRTASYSFVHISQVQDSHGSKITSLSSNYNIFLVNIHSHC